MTSSKVLVTGCAGFIGYHVAKKLLELNVQVVGLDNLNDYYDQSLKHDRLNDLQSSSLFEFYRYSLEDKDHLRSVFSEHRIDRVIHLAAQAGVRYSIQNPDAYIQSNLVGFANILENCRQHQIRHLVYASSSSVYGDAARVPFSTEDKTDSPVSLYAATKKANELLAHSYSHLYNLPATGIRFFTVYGPWGRPDMAYHIFSSNIVKGAPIKVFNNGEMMRDFTYIDDAVEAVVRILNLPPEENVPFRVLNVGNHKPEKLLEMIRILEDKLGKKAVLEFMPMQPGDVKQTYADISGLVELTGFTPFYSLEEGLGRFVDWFTSYYSWARR